MSKQKSRGRKAAQKDRKVAFNAAQKVVKKAAQAAIEAADAQAHDGFMAAMKALPAGTCIHKSDIYYDRPIATSHSSLPLNS